MNHFHSERSSRVHALLLADELCIVRKRPRRANSEQPVTDAMSSRTAASEQAVRIVAVTGVRDWTSIVCTELHHVWDDPEPRQMVMETGMALEVGVAIQLSTKPLQI
jgi:hypothetical protein